MAESDLDLRSSVNLLLQLTKSNEKASFNNGTEISFYIHKIPKFRQRFLQFYEETTPEIEVDDCYICTGRLKFYQDQKLYIYLETETLNDSEIDVSAATLWPVKVTWKVEAYDGRDPRNRQKALLLGEASCVFNRPRQGFKSHPNDWIAIDLAKIEGSGLIALDGSVTLRWSIFTERVLLVTYVEEFYKLLEIIDVQCESHDVRDTSLGCSSQDLEKFGEKLSTAEQRFTEINDKLSIIERETVGSQKIIMSMWEKISYLMNVIKHLLKDKSVASGGESEV